MTSNNPITVSIDGNQLYANSQLLGVVSLTGGDNISLDNSGSVINVVSDPSFTSLTSTDCSFGTLTLTDSAVDNDIYIHSGSDTHFDKCIEFKRTTGYRSYYMGLLGDNSTNQNKLAWGLNAGGDPDPDIKMVMNSAGRIGIHETNPTNGNLEVHATHSGDYTKIAYFKSSLSNNYWNINSTSIDHKRQNSDVLRILTSSNEVWIGNNTRNTWIKFKTDGTIKATGGVGSDSDDRIKHNEEIINNGLDVVRQLTPKKYFKSRDPVLDGNGDPIHNYNGDVSNMEGNDECGFIAQEVEAISGLEWCVSTPDTIFDEFGKFRPKSVSYQNLNMYLFDAVKKLDATVTALEARISTLENPP